MGFVLSAVEAAEIWISVVSLVLGFLGGLGIQHWYYKKQTRDSVHLTAKTVNAADSLRLTTATLNPRLTRINAAVDKMPGAIVNRLTDAIAQDARKKLTFTELKELLDNLLYDEHGNPKICPECGSSELKFEGGMIPGQDDTFEAISCKNCGQLVSYTG